MPKVRPELAVVLPLANEAQSVVRLVSDILAELAPADRLICSLDGVSTDGTLELVEAYPDDRVQLLWSPENTGISDAYFAGYRAALTTDAGWILEMDGGYSHLPSQIPRFLEAMSTGVDFAAGSRFVSGAEIDVPLRRYLLSRGGTVMANLMLGTRMKDMTSGFECFSRKAMEFVVGQGVQSKAHFFQTEIRYSLRDWNWVEVPITYRNDKAGVGSAPIWEAISNLRALRRSESAEPVVHIKSSR